MDIIVIQNDTHAHIYMDICVHLCTYVWVCICVHISLAQSPLGDVSWTVSTGSSQIILSTIPHLKEPGPVEEWVITG